MKLYKDRLLLGFGLGAGLFSLLIYFLTKAPTFSFWDCGEFIACAKILGIPHPPGYPLYTLIGRFAIMLPLPFNDPVKVNLVSVVSSALTVFAAYWLILRLAIGSATAIGGFWRRIGLAIGAFSGSLVMGFSSTFWDNAIEAECYGLAMMLTIIICYLVLLWSNKIGRPGSGKLLVAIVYLAFLSIGIHMTTFLVMPVIVLYMAIMDSSLMRDWRFWLIWIIMLLVTSLLDVFLYGLAAAFIISGILLLTTKHSSYMLKWVFAISAFAIIGYSTHLFLPMRAAHKPAINENNPDNWDRFNSLLERKQYGQESMVTRMFSRRASWQNQFGNYPHMGFWGFFQKQYSENWAAFLFFAVGIWGIYEAFKRNRINGAWVLTLFLISTLGLILYLNFSDGTRGEILEVRDRDYFYTPGFMFFGILIGIGLCGILNDLAEWAKNRRPRIYLLAAALVVALLFPLHTLQANYFQHDRSRNYIPWDYAYNILNSVDENGIVFTNGDNDTFPLWCIQEVEDVRTDVKVVNLSLLNTPWYIHQLKEQMGVPIDMSYDQIERLRPVWDAAKERIWKVQDAMIGEIVRANNWTLPVFFAVTVSEGNKLGLNDNMIMQGMAYKVVPDQGKNRVDPQKMWDTYMVDFRYRGLDDPTVYKNENDNRLVANYVSGFLQLADTVKNLGEMDRAISVAEKSIEVFPNEWRHRAYLSALYATAGRLGDIDKIVEGVGNQDIVRIYLTAGQELVANKRLTEGRDLLIKALQYDPMSASAFNRLLYAQFQLGDSLAIDSLSREWRELHKDDPKALSDLENLLRILKQGP